MRWENMPGIVNPKQLSDDNAKEWIKILGLQIHEPGLMTAREVLQYIGTEIFRKMIPTVWVDSLLNNIKVEASELALICDVRFPDEVQAIQAAGGKVIRLTRDPKQGIHTSETVLDGYVGFDATIDNKVMGFEEQHKEAYQLLKSWGIFP
jgi:hypothetical protein